MRIALTHSARRLAGLGDALAARGFEVVHCPLVATAPLLTKGARRAAAALADCPWLLFPSPAAVEAWEALGLPLDGSLLGAVGAGTDRALSRRGARVSLVGEPQTAAGLAAAFAAHPRAKGPVGLPRGDKALSTLQGGLEKRGYEVRVATVYTNRPLPWAAGSVDAVLLASPSAVAALPPAVAARARLVALGPTTAGAVAAAGWTCLQARSPRPEAVLEVFEGLVQT